MNDIDKYLENNEYIEILAKEIIKIFINKSNSENTYCEFDLRKGKIIDGKTNTWFCCDINKQDEILYKIKKELFKNLTIMTDDKEKEYQNKLISIFKKIQEKLTKKYKKELEDTIRKVCIPDSNKNVIPMSEIEVKTCDMTDIDVIYSPPGPYILNNYKDPNDKDYDPKLYKEPINIRMKNIMDFIIKKMQKTGEDAITIFDKEKIKSKEEKNPSFLTVNSKSVLKKLDWDLSLSFYVDYNLRKK